MGPIYAPRGRAEEYSFLALNLLRGCSSKCSYCYVPSASRMSREQWEKLKPCPRKDVIEALRRQAPQFTGTDKRVLLCFMCDPYQPAAVQSGVTREALKILRDYDIPWQILTKHGMAAAADFDLYGSRDAFATTLTYVANLDSIRDEPGARLPWDRMNAIREAHARGIRTWVSLEPVLDPLQSLSCIAETREWVDLYEIGKVNHDPEREAEIDWGRFAWQAMNLCNEYDKPFIFKKDLLAYCDFEIVGAAKNDPRIAGKE